MSVMSVIPSWRRSDAGPCCSASGHSFSVTSSNGNDAQAILDDAGRQTASSRHTWPTRRPCASNDTDDTRVPLFPMLRLAPQDHRMESKLSGNASRRTRAHFSTQPGSEARAWRALRECRRRHRQHRQHSWSDRQHDRQRDAPTVRSIPPAVGIVSAGRPAVSWCRRCRRSCRRLVAGYRRAHSRDP